MNSNFVGNSAQYPATFSHSGSAALLGSFNFSHSNRESNSRAVVGTLLLHSLLLSEEWSGNFLGSEFVGSLLIVPSITLRSSELINGTSDILNSNEISLTREDDESLGFEHSFGINVTCVNHQSDQLIISYGTTWSAAVSESGQLSMSSADYHSPGFTISGAATLSDSVGSERLLKSRAFCNSSVIDFSRILEMSTLLDGSFDVSKSDVASVSGYSTSEGFSKSGSPPDSSVIDDTKSVCSLSVGESGMFLVSYVQTIFTVCSKSNMLRKSEPIRLSSIVGFSELFDRSLAVKGSVKFFASDVPTFTASWIRETLLQSQAFRLSSDGEVRENLVASASPEHSHAAAISNGFSTIGAFSKAGLIYFSSVVGVSQPFSPSSIERSMQHVASWVAAVSNHFSINNVLSRSDSLRVSLVVGGSESKSSSAALTISVILLISRIAMASRNLESVGIVNSNRFLSSSVLRSSASPFPSSGFTAASCSIASLLFSTSDSVRLTSLTAVSEWVILSWRFSLSLPVVLSVRFVDSDVTYGTEHVTISHGLRDSTLVSSLWYLATNRAVAGSWRLLESGRFEQSASDFALTQAMIVSSPGSKSASHRTLLAPSPSGSFNNWTLFESTWDAAATAVQGMSRRLVESWALGISETFSAGGDPQAQAGSMTTGALLAIIISALILLIVASVLIWLCIHRNIGRASTYSPDLEMAYEVAPSADDAAFRFAADGAPVLTVNIDSETASDDPRDQSTFGSFSEEAAVM
jgi:hypothetical protein